MVIPTNRRAITASSIHRISPCRFLQADVWEGYDEHEKDEVEMEIVQPWLLPATEDEFAQQQKQRSKLHFHPREEAAHGLEHEHDHGACLWLCCFPAVVCYLSLAV